MFGQHAGLPLILGCCEGNAQDMQLDAHLWDLR